MCGRYSHSDKMSEIADLVRMARVDLQPRFNIAPTQAAPVLVAYKDHAALQSARWGLVPHWARDPSCAAKLINARSETVLEKPAFRNAFRLRRCLVIADGWYEWQSLGRHKQPWRVCAARGEGLITFAGLCEHWQPPAEPFPGALPPLPLRTFAILTTEAAEGLQWLHSRMPCSIHPADRMAWLNPATPTQDLLDMLLPVPASEFRAYRVTPRVGSTRFDSPEAIQPLHPPDLFAD